MWFANVQERMNVMVGDVRDTVSQGSTLSENSGKAAGTPPLTQVWKNVSEKHRNAVLAVRDFDLQSCSWCVLLLNQWKDFWHVEC